MHINFFNKKLKFRTENRLNCENYYEIVMIQIKKKKAFDIM